MRDTMSGWLCCGCAETLAPYTAISAKSDCTLPCLSRPIDFSIEPFSLGGTPPLAGRGRNFPPVAIPELAHGVDHKYHRAHNRRKQHRGGFACRGNITRD